MSMLILNVIHEPVYAPAWHKQACADTCKIPRGVIGCLSSLEFFFFKAKGPAAALEVEEVECLLSRKPPPPPRIKGGLRVVEGGFYGVSTGCLGRFRSEARSLAPSGILSRPSQPFKRRR